MKTILNWLVLLVQRWRFNRSVRRGDYENLTITDSRHSDQHFGEQK